MGNAFAGAVDGRDPLEMDAGFFGGGVVQNFKLRVVDHQAAAFGGFGFAVDNDVLVGRKGFGDEGHVEPPQGERSGEGLQPLKTFGVFPARRGEGDHHKRPAGTRTFELDIRDHALKAKGGAGFRDAIRPAIEGRAVYVSLGCVNCHTQQVRPAGQGSDIARGYGVRPSVARDYVLQKQVLLGDRRVGPDLANYGARAKDVDAVHAAIKHNGGFSFLYAGDKQTVASERAVALAAYLQSLRQDYSSPEAKLKQ